MPPGPGNEKEKRSRGRPPGSGKDKIRIGNDKDEKGANTDREFNEDQIHDEIHLCGTCSQMIDDENDASIMCDGACGRWHHLECEKMTIEVCNVLCSGNRNINWFCDKCVSRVKAMITDDKETDYIALKDRQQEMNEKIGKLEKKIEEGLQEMKETMDEENGNKLSALEKRLDDLEKKTRKNVIRKTFRELWNLRLKRHKALGPPFERWAD